MMSIRLIFMFLAPLQGGLGGKQLYGAWGVNNKGNLTMIPLAKPSQLFLTLSSINNSSSRNFSHLHPSLSCIVFYDCKGI